MTPARERFIEINLEDAQERILQALRGLWFGAVEIQVHDSRIVRITRTEKVRVERLGTEERDGTSPR